METKNNRELKTHLSVTFIREIKIIFFILLTAFISSCGGGLGPVDKSTLRQVSEAPDITSLVGYWQADSFSHKAVAKYYPLNDKQIKLEFFTDSTFNASNFPNFEGSGEPMTEELYDSKGEWKFIEYTHSKQKEYQLNLIFNAGKLYEKGMSTNCYLYFDSEHDDELIILIFLGDPDNGKRLLFRKKLGT